MQFSGGRLDSLWDFNDVYWGETSFKEMLYCQLVQILASQKEKEDSDVSSNRDEIKLNILNQRNWLEIVS